jgi:hypothetical protein
MTTLQFPKRPTVKPDRCFGLVRQTWRDRESGYVISRCAFLDYTLIYPKWAGMLPTHHRTLKAAMRAAEEHRNHE